MDIKQTQIESELLDWFNEMIKKYEWLEIKYEFDEKRKVFLVSFSPNGKMNNILCFNDDAVDFEDKMNKLYDTEAPLFTDSEELFKLSDNAVVYKSNN